MVRVVAFFEKEDRRALGHYNASRSREKQSLASCRCTAGRTAELPWRASFSIDGVSGQILDKEL